MNGVTTQAPLSTIDDSEWQRAELVATRDLSPTIRELTLRFEGRMERRSPCPAGSHLRIAIEVDGREDLRSYSVVAQEGDRLRIAVKRQPVSRGGSAFMWSLQPGATIRVAGPYRDFPLTLGAPEYLLIAGGVGITPMMTIAAVLAGRGDCIRLVYGARSAD